MRLLKNSVLYSGLGILDKGIGILLLPIYTRLLSPAEYGTISVVDSITVFLVLIYPIGSDATLMRTQFTEKDPQSLARLRGTIFTFLLLIGLVGTAFLTAGRQWLLEPFTRGVPFWPFLALGLLSAWFQPVQIAYLSILQARQDTMGYLSQAGGASVLRILLVFLFVVGFRWGAFGLLSAIVLPHVLFSLIALWRLRREVVWGIDWPTLWRSMAYSLPVVPHMLAGWTTGYLGVIVLNHFQGTAGVGLYGLAARFALIVGFVVTGVTQALQPQMYAYLAAPNEAAAPIARFKVLASLALYGIIATGVSLFAGDVIHVMAAPAFFGAKDFVPLLAFSAFVQGAYMFYSNALYFEVKGTRFLPIASIGGALVSLGLMFVLIPRNGAYGTAIATLSGVTVRMFLAAILGNAKAGVFWSQMRFALVFMATALACGLAWWLCSRGVSLWIRSAVFLASLLLPMLAAPFPLLTKVVTDNVQRAMKGRR